MTIKSLFLRNFRNYKEEHFTFGPKVNVIFGNNGQGKTNLLEAIYLLISGRSFRTRHLHELIRFGSEGFHIEILFEKHGIEQILKFSFDGHKRTLFHNATPLPNLSSLLGILNGVILSPEDHALVKGGPQTRREFLDLLLAQANPLYLHHLSRYLRAMKQRNFLLKQRSLNTISVWEEQMSKAAVYLTSKRQETITELEKIGQSEAIGTDQLSILYRSQALNSISLGPEALQLFFLKQFEKHRYRECDLKTTLSGPHRDDMTIFLHHKEARQFASEGQQRGIVASLKLAQWRWLKRLADQSPIFCIDDLGTSFDSSREIELCKRVENFEQVFITSTRPTPLSCHLIEICEGQVFL